MCPHIVTYTHTSLPQLSAAAAVLGEMEEDGLISLTAGDEAKAMLRAGGERGGGRV